MHVLIAIHRVQFHWRLVKLHFKRVTHVVCLRQGPSDGVHLTHGDQSGGLLPLLPDPKARPRTRWHWCGRGGRGAAAGRPDWIHRELLKVSVIGIPMSPSKPGIQDFKCNLQIYWVLIQWDEVLVVTENMPNIGFDWHQLSREHCVSRGLIRQNNRLTTRNKAQHSPNGLFCLCHDDDFLSDAAQDRHNELLLHSLGYQGDESCPI